MDQGAHTNPPPLGQSITFVSFYFHSLPLSLPLHAASICNWLYTLESWSRPKQCYIIPSITAQQAHKYKDTLFGSLPCLLPTILPSYVSLETHTVLPVNKYSLSFRIINTVLVKSSSLKDETECIWAYINTKHTELHCWKIFLLRLYTACFSSSFVFFFFFFWLQR